MLTPEIVFRLYETAGVPDSGNHQPKKSEIIQLLNLLFGVSRGGWVVARTLTELNSITPPNATDGGVVLTGTGAGYYDRDSGAWVFGRGFPDTFARVALSGSGVAQSGLVNTGVNPASIEVFFAQVVTQNTGPLTLSIDGSAARAVINVAGNPLSAGEWTGMVMFYLNAANQYQLLIDAGAAASAAASASAANSNADRAETEADRAQAIADSIVPGTVLDGSVTEPKLASSLQNKLVGVAATRSALAAMSGTAYLAVNLMEAGRKGIFTWSGGNLAAEVTADPSQGLYVPPTATPSGASGAWVRQITGPVDVRWYGAVGDGVADDTAAIQAFITGCVTKRRHGVFPPLQYKIMSQINILGALSADFEKTVLFEAYGAVFDIRGATYPFRVSDWGNGCKLAWRGGAFWSHNSTACFSAFIIEKSGHHLFEDMIFRGGASPGQSVFVGFKAFDIRQQDLANQDTGAFWTMIRGCIFGSQRDSGTNTALWLNTAINLRGAANATTVVDCQFERCVYPVFMYPDNNGYMANGVLVTQSHFEMCSNGVHMNSNSLGPVAGGLRITENRVENVSQAFLSILNTTGNHGFLSPPSIGFNATDSATPLLINNPNNRFVQNLDNPQRSAGFATLSGATFIDVAFAPTFGRTISTNYIVTLEHASNQNFWVSNKTATGFRINAEVASSLTIGWSATRTG